MAAAGGLTVRALATGALLGAVLGVANLYVGLKVGWSVGVVVTAAVLGGGWIRVLRRISPRVRPLGRVEGAALASTASAAGYSTGASLASAAAAYAMLTGHHPPLPWLMAWVLVVAALGVALAVALRPSVLERDRLPFPSGRAAAEVLTRLQAGGGPEARVLVGAAAVAALIAWAVQGPSWGAWPRSLALPSTMPPLAWIAGSVGGLGWALSTGLLAPAAGALVGPRIAASLLAGAVLCFALGPLVPGPLQGLATYPDVARWSVWPGSAAMVVAGTLSLWTRSPGRVVEPASGGVRIPRAAVGSIVALVVAIGVVQVMGFDVPVALAAASGVLALGLAVVAAKVTGETDVGPAGPLGKVAQLALGPLGGAATNVMGAGVSAAAAASAADMLTDFKMGQELGAAPRIQLRAQALGVVVGVVVVVPAFVWIVVPDPAVLGSTQWPAPAASVWTAFARVAVQGRAALPPGALVAMGLAGVVAALLVVSGRRWSWMPSPLAMGLACVLPPGTSVAMALGAAAGAWLGSRNGTAWVAAAAGGAIAGESMTGVFGALLQAATQISAGS